MSDTAYGVLKQTTTLVLPALGALYFALAQIWHLPKAEEVVGTIAAVNTFAGVLLGISTRSYNNSTVAFDGTLMLDGSAQMASIELNQGPESVVNKPVAIFKVENGE